MPCPPSWRVTWTSAWSVRSARLAAEVRLPVVRLEESSDRSVCVECDERAALSVESGDGAVGAPELFDAPAHRCVAKLLRLTQVLLLRDAPALRAVLREVLVELSGRAES